MRNLTMQSPRDILGRSWFLLLLLAVFAVTGFSYGKKILHNRSAILRWQPQLLELDNNVDLSERFQYPNPPIMAVLLYPLAKLPPIMAAAVWFCAKIGFALLSLYWVFRLIAPRDRSFPEWAQALTVLLSMRLILSDLQHGNVNLFILFLVIAALTAFRCRQNLLSGLLLALAIACKVTPALFLPYLVWKRAWRALAGAVVGLALFLWPGFVPAQFLGWHENQQQLTSWYRDMVRPFVVDGKVWSEHNNQSLPGLAYRMLSASPSFSRYDNDVYVPTEWHNVANLDAATVRWIVKGCMGLFVVLIVWCCRTGTQRRTSWRLSAEFAIVLLGMLLFSERTWKHHCVTLMLPIAVICYHLSACRPSRSLRNFLIAALALATLLIESTSTSLAGDFAKTAQTYGAFVWAYLVLLAALVVLLRQPMLEPAAASEELRTVREIFAARRAAALGLQS